MDQRAADRHALAHAAGQFGRPLGQEIAEPDLLDFFGKLPSKDKQFVFVSGLAHAATLGINRHKFWHAMESFMRMPATRALAAS